MTPLTDGEFLLNIHSKKIKSFKCNILKEEISKREDETEGRESLDLEVCR